MAESTNGVSQVSGGRGLYAIPDMPALSTFGQINISGTVSAVENSGKAISIIDSAPPYGGITLNGLTKATPAASPYRVAILCLPNMLNTAYLGFAVGFSDGTKYHTLLHAGGYAFGMSTWSNSITRVTYTDVAPLPSLGGVPIWLGLRDDGTSVFWEISYDGANYLTIATTTKSAGYLGANGYTSIFFGLYDHNNTYTSPSGYPLSASFLAYDENGLSRTVGGTGGPCSPNPYSTLTKNSRSADYTAVLSDNWLDHPVSDANPRTFTIPSNASVAYTIGTQLLLTNESDHVLTVNATSDGFQHEKYGSLTSFGVPSGYSVTILKLSSTVWLVKGVIVLKAAIWRLPFANNSVSGNAGVSELYLRDVAGGASIATGGTATASGTLLGGSENAFDNNTATSWTQTGRSGWIQYEFNSATPVYVVEFGVVPTEAADEAPVFFSLDCSIDDGATFIKGELIMENGWTANATKTYSAISN